MKRTDFAGRGNGNGDEVRDEMRDRRQQDSYILRSFLMGV